MSHRELVIPKGHPVIHALTGGSAAKLQNSVGSLEKGKSTKADTYKKVKECAAKFREKNQSIICRELKGIGSDRPICSCDQCIEDAVQLTEAYLAANPVK